MKKRNFLKTIGGISTVFSIPALAASKPQRLQHPDPVWSVIYGTANEIDVIYNTWGNATQDELARAIEAKLKERNT